MRPGDKLQLGWLVGQRWPAGSDPIRNWIFAAKTRQAAYRRYRIACQGGHDEKGRCVDPAMFGCPDERH